MLERNNKQSEHEATPPVSPMYRGQTEREKADKTSASIIFCLIFRIC